MARVYVSTVVNARNDRVWARVRDFNGMPNWHPAIAESRIEGGEPADKIGCVRDFRLRNGDRIREKLLGLSDYDMFCTYSILESPMGVENYVATLAADAGDRRRPDVPGVDGRVRLRARARERTRQQYRDRRVPGRLRRAQARLRRLACRISSKARSSTRRPARSGMCCAISTATTAGTPRWRPAPSSARKPPTRSAASALQAAGRLRVARAIAGALGSRADLQLLPARYADPNVQLRRPVRCCRSLTATAHSGIGNRASPHGRRREQMTEMVANRSIRPVSMPSAGTSRTA